MDAGNYNLKVLLHVEIGLYKILLYCKAFVSESSSSLYCPSICNAHTIAILLHDYCAVYALPPTLPSYAIHHTILVAAISWKGQRRDCWYLVERTPSRAYSPLGHYQRWWWPSGEYALLGFNWDLYCVVSRKGSLQNGCTLRTVCLKVLCSY